MTLDRFLDDLDRDIRAGADWGAVAEYIPELARVDPAQFEIAVALASWSPPDRRNNVSPSSRSARSLRWPASWDASANNCGCAWGVSPRVTALLDPSAGAGKGPPPQPLHQCGRACGYRRAFDRTQPAAGADRGHRLHPHCRRG